jgi:L-lactate dehydrogenase complex protein LldG
MTDAGARAEILSRIRASLKRGTLDEASRRRLTEKLASPARGPIPARGQGDLPTRVATFIAQAERVSTSVERVAKQDDVPEAVQCKLKGLGFPLSLRAARDGLMARIDWSHAPSLVIDHGPARVRDRVCVTSAFAGIAETGTLFFYSSPETPTTLNFVPELHIVLLDAQRIVASYEDAFDMLKAVQPAGNARLPRTINLVTGPSRTSDVERTLTLGAHGPRVLHVILIGAH